jgi:hypothetical protein
MAKGFAIAAARLKRRRDRPELALSQGLKREGCLTTKGHRTNATAVL